ncbi:hypothetical protein ACI7BZ_12205 [Xanthobacter sp. AM11]|uniref:hypothetical protein n=1 Tax=Xanthobacter sp. AM11 TaxID=3380643 RepID=UPI0039BEE86A
MTFVAKAPPKRKKNLPTPGYFPAQDSNAPARIIARKVSERIGIPFAVALAHIEAAGLGKEAAHV